MLRERVFSKNKNKNKRKDNKIAHYLTKLIINFSNNMI